MPRRYSKALIKKKAYQQQKEIAAERVEILLKYIKENKAGSYTPRYITLIEKLSRRWKLRFPKDLEGCYCLDCKRYFVPGKNCSIRVKEKKSMIICKCGTEWPAKQRLFKH